MKSQELYKRLDYVNSTLDKLEAGSEEYEDLFLLYQSLVYEISEWHDFYQHVYEWDAERSEKA